METLFGKMRSLDAYPKINADFYSRTLSDGVITLDSSIFMLLFISELTLPCSIVSLDAMDMSGEQHTDVVSALERSYVDIGCEFEPERNVIQQTAKYIYLTEIIKNSKRHDIIKRRIDAHGNFIETRVDTIGAPKIERPLQSHGGRLEHNETHCGSCYGAEVISHKVNRLAFGDYFPGVMNPLDGVQWTQQTPNAMYQYFLRVVPTLFTDETGIPSIQIRCDLNTTGAFNTLLHCMLGSFYWKGLEIHNIPQFSVTEHVKVAELGRLQALPEVFFFYDLSPIKVAFTETHVSFLHFLTNVCAIVGGVFTVSGIIDSFVYHSQKGNKKKNGPR